MKLNPSVALLAVLVFTVVSHAGDSPFQMREPLPWNLLENGGFERDGAGLFAVGLSQRDRENPASGDACGRFEIPPEKTSLVLSISSGLRLEKDKDYIVAGRMRTALMSDGAEARVQATMLSPTGVVSKSYTALRLHGLTQWQTFVLRVRGDGTSALRFSLIAKGTPGERLWLDDLFVGPAHVDLSYQAAPGSGLLQAAIADGMQFEFPIPAQTHVMGVFRNGRRLLETKDCEVLYGAQVVRLFETPARGEHLSVVLRSTVGRAQIPALPLNRYAIFSKAGVVDAWLPDAIPEFKAPDVDYAVLEHEVIDLPSIDGLPTEWSADSKRAIELKVHAAGRYSLRLRDDKNRTVATVAEFVPLATGATLQTQFNGCDDSGAPLPAGNYVWDVLHRPLNAFSQVESFPVSNAVRRIWRSQEKWMMLVQKPVQGRPAFTVMSAESDFRPGEQKAVLFVNRIDAFVEARPGVYFYVDAETGLLHKFENGAAHVFPKSELVLRGQSVVLAAYESPAGPGLFVGYRTRAADDSGTARDAIGAVLKLDANGDLVAEFGERGRVRSTPSALEPLEDGGVLIVESGASAWLKSLGPNGALRKFWRSPRGGSLADAARIELSEEAYSFTRAMNSLAERNTKAERSAAVLARTPTGEILIAPKIEGDSARELQVYSARSEFITVLGRGPEQAMTVEAPGYTRLWSTNGSNGFQSVDGLGMDARGDLFVFDRSAGLVKRWTAAPRISNVGLTIKAASKAEVPALVASDPLPEGFTIDALKQRHGLSARTVDFVDLALTGAGHGLRDDGASAVIRKAGMRPYRLSGAEHCSWFRAQLQVENPGRMHLLLVEYPDDVQRRTLLALRSEGSAVAKSMGLDAGYANGGAQALSGKERYFTMLTYPRGPVLSVEFLSSLESGSQAPVGPLYGAAASRVWLLEIDGALPENPVEEPLTGAKRSIGEHRGSIEALLEDFGSASKDAPNQAEAMQKSIGAAAALNTWLGFNGLDQAAFFAISKRLYPSVFFKERKNPVEAGSRVTLESAKDSSAGIYFTFYGLAGVPPERPELKDLGLVNEHGHADANNLSLIYPEVQQYFRDVILELAQQGKDSPRFAGVTIQMDAHATPLFGIPGVIDAGFEAASLKAFEAASKKTIAGESLSAQVASLKGELREDWSAWRCGVVRDWVFSVRDELKKIRPDLQLRLYANASGADLRFYGFDRALYKDQENIRVFDAPPETAFLFASQTDARARWKDLKPVGMTDVLEFNAGVGREGSFLKEGSASVMVSNKEHIPGPLVAAFVRQNPRSISLLTWARASVGCELELRDFARAFRSLPFAPAEELSGAGGGLKIYRYGGKGAAQYLAVVNPTDGDVKATVTVADGPAVTTARDLVGGRDIPAKQDNGGVGFEVSVPAGNMRTYRLGK